jgi:hypothetical protein
VLQGPCVSHEGAPKIIEIELPENQPR